MSLQTEATPNQASPILRAQRFFLFFYIIALATSMSGMEIFSTGLTLALVLALLFSSRDRRRRFHFWLPFSSSRPSRSLESFLEPHRRIQNTTDIGRMRFFLLYAILFYTLRFYARDFPWLKVLLGVTVVIGVYRLLSALHRDGSRSPGGKQDPFVRDSQTRR